MDKPRILLIDDEPNVLTGLKRTLSHRYHITMATNAQDALEIVATHPPFCVAICDIRMPGMNGIELLHIFKQNVPDMVRMVLSGTAELDTAISAVNSGEIFRFHTKPAATEVLLASIDSAVEKHKQNLEAASCQALKLAEQSFRQALSNQEFELYLQPQFDSQTQQFTSAEALIRWKHPYLGILTPGTFLPEIESFGGIPDLTSWVVENACGMLNELRESCDENFTIAVNITAMDLSDDTFPQRVKDCLKKHQIPPKLFELELVEGMEFDNESRSLIALKKLSDLGIRLSLDDFGTGYSAFGRLRHLPIQKLKIDRIFVTDLNQGDQALTIVKAIVQLAKDLKLDVIAEGVETNEQVKILNSIGCFDLQGFYYAKPMPKTDFIAWYNNHVRPT